MREQGKDKKGKKLQAAALKYDARTDAAPRVVGVGQGHVAEAMMKAAQENDVPILEDAGLAAALQALGIGEDIPEELYQVIAEVMVFVAKLDEERIDRFGLTGVVHPVK